MHECKEIEVLFPACGSGYIVALRAYLDASVRETGTISVAGFAFGLANAKKANNAWSKLFGDKVCHMTDLHNLKKDFSTISKCESSRLLIEAIKILKKYSSYSVATTFNIDEVSDYLPKEPSSVSTCEKTIRGYENPYAICCHFTMHLMGRLVAGDRSEISYIFEAGDEGQKALLDYGNYIIGKNQSSLSDMYGADSISVAKKQGRELLLQSADILAWECAKNVDRRKDGIKMRPSLSALFDDNINEDEHEFGFTYFNDERSVVFNHFEGERLIEMLGLYDNLFKIENSKDIEKLKGNFEDFFNQPF